MTTNSRPRESAFLDLQENEDGSVYLWCNRTLLPTLSTALQTHQHPSLQDFSLACSQFFRNQIEEYRNEHCSISPQQHGSLTGASLVFQSDILEAASRALIGGRNSAVTRIGFELQKVDNRRRGVHPEIHWRRQGHFLCGVNVPSRSATLSFNRSTLQDLASHLPSEHPMSRLFQQLVDILDPHNHEVDAELDESTAAVDEDLCALQEIE